MTPNKRLHHTSNFGLEAPQYAGHSFRIGAATTAAEKDIEDSLKLWEDGRTKHLHKDSPRHTC